MSENEKSNKKIRAKLDQKFGFSNHEVKSSGSRYAKEATGAPEGAPTYGSQRGQLERELREQKYAEKQASAGEDTGSNQDAGAKRHDGDRPRYDDKRSFGDRPRFDNKRSDGDRPRYDDKRSFGNKRKFGDRPRFDNKRGDGDRPRYDDKRSFDNKRSFGDRPRYDDRRSFTDRPRRHEGERNFEDRPKTNPRPWMRDKTGTSTSPASELSPPWLKRVLRLTTDKGREKEECFLAEGVRCVQELVQYHAEIVREVFVVDTFGDSTLLKAISDRSIQIQTITVEEMELVATTVNTQGILAICRSASVKPDYDMARVLTLVDGVQDPGNLGSVYRTSLGFGADGVILGKGTVSPFNPKVVRGSSGTFMRVPFEQGVDLLERIVYLRQKGFTIIATDLHAKQSLEDLAPRKLRKVALLIGNEGSGADIKHIQHADEVVKIPMEHNLESLNVAVAHGIMIYQIKQQLKTT